MRLSSFQLRLVAGGPDGPTAPPTRRSDRFLVFARGELRALPALTLGWLWLDEAVVPVIKVKRGVVRVPVRPLVAGTPAGWRRCAVAPRRAGSRCRT
jgi:hypothetical protein